MPKTTVRENESLDEALRRFKRQVNKALETPGFAICILQKCD